MRILTIETSCDDTGVALLDIKKNQIKILVDFVSSQNEIHAPYGGVVPNLAVRAHYKNLPILLERVLAKVDPKKIDLIAATIGPGLEPCLWAGINTARVLAKAMKKPIIGVNHLEGHIAANFIAANSKLKTKNSKLLFPAICLIVSGGHTQLVLIKKIAARGEPRLWRGEYKVIGQTRDDAAGEAFDKVAKMLGLGYPGGPQIVLKAKNGRSDAFELPRPMIDSPDFDFSFSGLKTAVLYLLKNMDSRLRKNDKTIKNLCASFQQAAVDVLVSKTIKAAVEYKAKALCLLEVWQLIRNCKNESGTLNCQKTDSLEKPEFLALVQNICTDNAVMIGLAGYWKFMRQGKGDEMGKMVAKANLNL